MLPYLLTSQPCCLGGNIETVFKAPTSHCANNVNDSLCALSWHQAISSSVIDSASAALGGETLNPSSFRTIQSDLDSTSAGLSLAKRKVKTNKFIYIYLFIFASNF